MKIRFAMILVILSGLIGGMIGKYLLHNNSSKVYLFNESRFFTLAALGLLSGVDDQNSFAPKLSSLEVNQIKQLTEKLNETLMKMSKHAMPILIEKKDKKLELYQGTEFEDITNSLAKQVIGEEKWQQIGQRFLQ